MFKKIFIALICMVFFAVPVSSQESPYQDLLDDIQKRHPDGVLQMPAMVQSPETPRQHFETGTENSPILKLVKEGWVPSASRQSRITFLNPSDILPKETIIRHHHHYDTPDPVLTLITAPPPTPLESQSFQSYYPVWNNPLYFDTPFSFPSPSPHRYPR